MTSRPPGSCPDLPRQLVAVDAGQADVDKGHVRPGRRQQGQRVVAVVGLEDDVALRPEHDSVHFPRIGVVVDQQHAVGGARGELVLLGVRTTARRHCGHSHGKDRALPFALAERFNPSAVQLDQAAHQRETDAQSALRAVDGVLGLDEQIEDAREQLAIDAGAFVRDREHGLTALGGDGHVHRLLRRGELQGVGDEIADDLLDAHGIAV